MADDRARASDYSDPMSDRLLGIAADVLRSFGSAFGGRHLAIVGGAVPGLRIPEPPTGMDPHVGTGDLDLHLSLHLMDGETADYYAAIIDGLQGLGLKQAKEDERQIKWRWVGRYRDTQLQVEFLCPTRTAGGRPEPPAAGTAAEANIGPTGEITALAVGYGHLVLPDTDIIPRRVETARGSMTYDFPVAGLGSWLCLKADAIMRRDKLKDAYDVVWLLDALGPEEATRLIASSPLLESEYSDAVRSQFGRLIDDQFMDDESAGPTAYADFLNDDAAESQRRHAQGTVSTFGKSLRGQGLEIEF